VDCRRRSGRRQFTAPGLCRAGRFDRLGQAREVGGASPREGSERRVGGFDRQLVHFLDNVDTVAPDFYDKTAEFLTANARYGGVVTLAERVVERRLDDGSFETIERLPHYPELRAVSLAELAVVQTFAPVSVVARRECLEAIGGFNEQFEVCEDYDLYLRFLTRFDIGVVPEVLCAFHQREEGNVSETWLNSFASRQHRIEDNCSAMRCCGRISSRAKWALGASCSR
jgi:hypothetical protein